MAVRRLPRQRQIAEFQMHVVEQVGDKAFRHFRRVSTIRSYVAGRNIARVFFRPLSSLRSQSAGLLDFELADHLRLALVEDLKVFLVQVPDGMPPRVADYHAYDHQLHVDLDGRGFVVRRKFCRGLLRVRLRGRNRRWRRRHVLCQRMVWTNQKPHCAQ